MPPHINHLEDSNGKLTNIAASVNNSSSYSPNSLQYFSSNSNHLVSLSSISNNSALNSNIDFTPTTTATTSFSGANTFTTGVNISNINNTSNSNITNLLDISKVDLNHLSPGSDYIYSNSSSEASIPQLFSSSCANPLNMDDLVDLMPNFDELITDDVLSSSQNKIDSNYIYSTPQNQPLTQMNQSDTYNTLNNIPNNQEQGNFSLIRKEIKQESNYYGLNRDYENEHRYLDDDDDDEESNSSYSCSSEPIMPGNKSDMSNVSPFSSGSLQGKHGRSGKGANEKRYGPIVVRPRKNPAPTLASGRRSKYINLPEDEAVKREIRRRRNRQAAEKCKQKRNNIEENLESELKSLQYQQNMIENEKKQLLAEKIKLESLLMKHKENCKNGTTSSNALDQQSTDDFITNTFSNRQCSSVPLVIQNKTGMEQENYLMPITDMYASPQSTSTFSSNPSHSINNQHNHHHHHLQPIHHLQESHQMSLNEYSHYQMNNPSISSSSTNITDIHTSNMCPTSSNIYTNDNNYQITNNIQYTDQMNLQMSQYHKPHDQYIIDQEQKAQQGQYSTYIQPQHQYDNINKW